MSLSRKFSFAVAALATYAIVNSARAGGILESIVMLPLATSAVTVGLGLLITFNRPPIDFRGSWWLVPTSHALVALPVVVRIPLPAVRAVPDGLREAAAMLGASPLRAWWAIDGPVLRRASAAGAGFAAAVSLGEFGASSMLTRTGADTVPIAIGRLLGRPSTLNLAAASALSTVLAAVTVALVLAADRRRDDAGAWF